MTPPNPCCRRELLDLADALVPTPDQDPFIRVLRARANGPRFAYLDDDGHVETCRIGHNLHGACELPHRHDGPHSRTPGGATEANRWWGTTCECDGCRDEHANLRDDLPDLGCGLVHPHSATRRCGGRA